MSNTMFMQFGIQWLNSVPIRQCKKQDGKQTKKFENIIVLSTTSHYYTLIHRKAIALFKHTNDYNLQKRTAAKLNNICQLVLCSLSGNKSRSSTPIILMIGTNTLLKRKIFFFYFQQHYITTDVKRIRI